MWRLFNKTAVKRIPPRFGESRSSEPGIIYAAYGTIKATEHLCIHYLSCRAIESYQVLPISNAIGRTIAGQLLAAENQELDRKALEQLLALNTPISHVIEFGFYFRRDGSKKELFKAAFNFRINGYSTRHVAIECCRFLEFVAHEQVAYVDEDGQLRPPPLLTQSKVWIREFWATAVFRRYRRFAVREES